MRFPDDVTDTQPSVTSSLQLRSQQDRPNYFITTMASKIQKTITRQQEKYVIQSPRVPRSASLCALVSPYQNLWRIRQLSKPFQDRRRCLLRSSPTTPRRCLPLREITKLGCCYRHPLRRLALTAQGWSRRLGRRSGMLSRRRLRQGRERCRCRTQGKAACDTAGVSAGRAYEEEICG